MLLWGHIEIDFIVLLQQAYGLNLDVFIKENMSSAVPLSILTQIDIQRRGRRMSFFAVTLTGSFKERNEFECLINRLVSRVKPSAFNQLNLFARQNYTMGTKVIDMQAGWASFNLEKCFPHHHPALNTRPGQWGEFFILSAKCCQVSM